MSVIEGVTSGAFAGVGAEAFSPAHATQYPYQHGALGQYRIAPITGVLAAALAANGEIFQFRWTDATRLCVVLGVFARIQVLTKFTAATISGAPSLHASIARSWSADGTGGTAITLTGNQAKLRTSMASSLCNSTGQRIATTAALGAGTKTLDTLPFARSGPGKGNDENPAAATEALPQNQPMLDYDPLIRNEHPIILAQNEGVVVANSIVLPAAGTIMVTLEFTWAELTVY